MTWPLTHPADSIRIATSCGLLALSDEEYALLERVLAGEATVDEGQRFYQSITGRGLPFPLEWEAAILRATLAALPGRPDLSERLAIVEASLGATISGGTEDPLLNWEQTLARFSTLSLLDGDPEVRTAAREQAFADACTLLSSPAFGRMSLPVRKAALLTIHNTLLSAPGPDLIPVAELGLRQLKRMLKEATLSSSDAMAAYDAVYSLYFSGASDVADLRRFDSVVPNFEAYLDERTSPKDPRPRPDPAGKLNIAYLLHTAHFDRGNAVSRLIVSLAEMHAQQENRNIFLYLVQHVSPDFVSDHQFPGVTVRSFPQDNRYDRIDEIADALAADRIDVVVTEQNRAIAAALFARRVAPLQLWADTGFPYWNLQSLDWTLAPAWPGAPDPVRRISALTWRQKSETLKDQAPPDEVAAARRQFPDNAFVLGVFVRLVKLTPAFFALLERALAQDASYHLFIAGTGDAAAVHAFIANSPHHERIHFHHGNVDLNIYGQVVDVMCDTFPFIGGNACREVGSHGTPVISMLGTPWDEFLRSDRDPELLVTSENQYIDRLEKLRTDVEFRNQKNQAALARAAEQADPSRMLEDVEAAINLACKSFDKGKHDLPSDNTDTHDASGCEFPSDARSVSLSIPALAQHLHGQGYEVSSALAALGLPVAANFPCLNERPLFFVHIPKTAGASVNHFLEAQFDDDKIFPGWNPPDLSFPSTGRLKYKLYRGHFTAGQRCYGPSDAELFSILRRPLTQIYSFYAWLRRLDKSYWLTAERAATQYSVKLKTTSLKYERFIAANLMKAAKPYCFESFLESLLSYDSVSWRRFFLQDNQSVHLSDCGDPLSTVSSKHRRMVYNNVASGRHAIAKSAFSNAKSCVVLGVFEQLEASIMLLCSKRHWPAPDSFARIHVNSQHIAFKSISQKSRRRVKYMAANDIKLHEHALARHHKEWEYLKSTAGNQTVPEFLNEAHARHFFQNAEAVCAIDICASKAWPGSGWGLRERNQHGQFWRWIGQSGKVSFLMHLLPGTDYLFGLYIHTASDSTVLESVNGVCDSTPLFFAGQGQKEGYTTLHWLIDRNLLAKTQGKIVISLEFNKLQQTHALAVSRIVCHPW